MPERTGNHSLARGQGKRKDPGTRLSFFEVRSDADVGGQEVLQQFSVVKEPIVLVIAISPILLSLTLLVSGSRNLAGFSR